MGCQRGQSIFIETTVTSGTFAIALGLEESVPLPFDSSAHYLEAELEKLKGIRDVTVVKTSETGGTLWKVTLRLSQTLWVQPSLHQAISYLLVVARASRFATMVWRLQIVMPAGRLQGPPRLTTHLLTSSKVSR